MRNGFTPVEVLMVVVIVAIVTIVGNMVVSSTSDIRTRSHRAMMQVDLQTLETFETQFAAEKGGRYTASLDSVGFSPSQDNVVTVDVSKPGQFTASVLSPSFGDAHTCSLAHGGVGTQGVACNF